MPQSARLRSSVAYAALNSAGDQRTLLAAGGLEGVSGSRHVFSSRNSAILKGLAQVSKWRVDWVVKHCITDQNRAGGRAAGDHC